MNQFDESCSLPSSLDDESHTTVTMMDGAHLKCMCTRIRVHTAPLLVSIFGLFICTLFTVFYSLQHEYILLFALSALYIDHFMILLGNRLRAPKLYALFVYSIKFLITMLVTGMLFYIYVVVGDAKRHSNDDLWLAFRAERVRVIVAALLLLFAIAHRWFLHVVKADYECMQYERLVQRTATIYSLMSEAQSRDERDKMSPYGIPTTILIRPLLEEV